MVVSLVVDKIICVKDINVSYIPSDFLNSTEVLNNAKLKIVFCIFFYLWSPTRRKANIAVEKQNLHIKCSEKMLLLQCFC